MPRLNNIVCAGCECACDDIVAAIDGGSIQFENACRKGDQWVARALPTCACQIDGRPAEVNEAIEYSSRLLSESVQPLLTGMENLSTEGQQEFVNLAIQNRATIDTTFSTADRSGVFALQRQGTITATLGEVNSRGDIIVFWFCDPLTTHPRLIERYCSSSKQIIVVDSSVSQSTKNSAFRFIQATPSQILHGIASLRMGLTGQKPFDFNDPVDSTKLNSDFDWLAKTLTSAKYAVSFAGQTQTDSQFDALTESIVALTRELTSKTRAVVLGLRTDGNSISAENVLTWMSGVPFATRLFSDSDSFDVANRAANQLRNGACDLVIIGSGTQLPVGKSADRLAATNSIWFVSDEVSQTTAVKFGAKVIFAVSRPGISESGSWCRLDDVSLPLRKLVDSPFPSAAELFSKISSFQNQTIQRGQPDN